MRLIVDRIENGIIVAEMPDKTMTQIAHAACPEAKDGDIIEIKVLDDDTKLRKKRIDQKMNKLFK